MTGTAPPMPPTDIGPLGSWGLRDAVACCARLRTCAEGSTSVEVASRRIVRFLRTAITDGPGGQPAFVLARLFKTDTVGHLPIDLQEIATQRLQGPVDEDVRCLALLGTDGDEPAWGDRRLSKDHQVIPLPSVEAVVRAPMVSALVSDLGLTADQLVHGVAVDPEEPNGPTSGADFDVFHIRHARGSPSVPDQDFVRHHGVESVLGFGGLMPSGHVFAVVLFSRVEIPEDTARLFRIVAASTKLALLPLSSAPLFEGQDQRPARPLAAAEARVAALEQMLAVHEQTTVEQAAALEASLRLLSDRDARLRREADIIETLRGVGESLSSVLDVDAVVTQTTAAAVDVTGAEFGAFFYNVDDERGQASTRYALAGAPTEAFDRFPIPRNTDVLGPTFRGDAIVRSADITQDRRYGRSEPHFGLPTGHLPVRSYLAAPVVSPSSGDVLGGLFLGHGRRDVFDDRAERLLAGIAAQAAVAFDNANLYRRERHTALELQRALMPGEFPDVPGVRAAHIYRPATAGLDVGGDWYDIIPLEGGRSAFVIGDVMGHGVHAAASMGQLRTSTRAFASLDLPPSEVAARLNAMVLDLPDEQIATLVYAVYDPTSRVLTITSAGHLPPLLVVPDRTPELIAERLGPPLGIPGGTYAQSTVDVPAGATVVFYTDGLVESRARDAYEGIEELRRLLDHFEATPDEMGAKLVATLAGVESDDDVALLFLTFA